MDMDTLIGEREIYRQLVRFARAMDDRDWEAISTIASADISADLGIGEIQGRDAMIAFMRSFLDDCGVTQHLLGNVLIDITGDTATSKCYVSDMHLDRDSNSSKSFRTLGDYHDHWRRKGDQWLLIRRVKHNRGTLGNISILGRVPEQPAG